MSKQNELAQLADAVTVSGSNVGIGTSSPAVQNNGAGIVLDLANTGSANTTADNTELVVRSSSRYAALSFITPTDKAATINFGDTDDANIGIVQYNHADNAMSFSTSATERMKIDGSGRVTKPYQPAFLARPSGYQENIPNLTTTTVTFATEVFDQNSDFSSSTFTAPVTGKYQLNFGLRLEVINSASSYYHIHLRTSNRLYAVIFDPRAFDQNPDYWDAGLGVLADMDAGDTAYITVFQAFGTAQMDIQQDSFFSGYLVA